MRYAVDGTVAPKCKKKFDVVIVGAGLAGLYSALHIKRTYSCCVIAKDSIEISNSWLAQGGIAAAISDEDNPELHLKDTLIAGAGECDIDAVRDLVNEGPSDIRELVLYHVPFDYDEHGDLAITREGGHHMNRIVHAGGDATGRKAVQQLAFILSERQNVTFMDNTDFVDIITNEHGAVSGALTLNRNGEYTILETPCIIMASGGIGQVYSVSTNADIATGDGIAAAARAGALLKDMEFVQFHPTGLWSEGQSHRAFLISEAVRGEGAKLVNSKGERFMLGAHELNELAPRDIVARAIFKEMQKSGESHVFLDITDKSEDFLSHRFPTIYNECKKRGINISKDWIPVRPVHHYFMGGISIDLHARTNIPGLYACGECACTGVHGANRLASNSMLECLVFGRHAAENVNIALDYGVDASDTSLPALPVRPPVDFDLGELRVKIQRTMGEYCGVIRNEAGLQKGLQIVSDIKTKAESVHADTREYYELLNIATTAQEILEAALARRESVGAHFRED